MATVAERPQPAPTPARQAERRQRRRRSAWRRQLVALAFMSPWIVGFTLFYVYPMAASLYFSFTHYDILSEPTWVGLDNYRFMFTADAQFWPSVRNTMWIIVFLVPLQVLFALSLGEPLACIIHCQIWLPLAFHDYFAAQHQHEHHQHTHQIVQQAPDPTPIDTAGLYSTDTSTALLCGMPGMGAGSNAPFYVPPSPVHDMLLAPALFFVILLLLGARPAAPPGDPPPIFLPRPLRPPILLAA